MTMTFCLSYLLKYIYIYIYSLPSSHKSNIGSLSTYSFRICDVNIYNNKNNKTLIPNFGISYGSSID